MPTFDEYFAERAFTREDLEFCGGDLVDDSIFFNIFDYAGNPQGFVERRLNSSPRYVNGMTSSDSLYPIHVTYPYIERANEAVIVEGPSDALALYANGIKNVVSFQGASNFGKRKLRLLRRHCENLWFIFDRDDAGVIFMNHVRGKMRIAFKVQGCFIPDGNKDPAEYIAAGKSIHDLVRLNLN